MKEFLENVYEFSNNFAFDNFAEHNYEDKAKQIVKEIEKDLFDMLWERGGKQFAKFYGNKGLDYWEETLKEAKFFDEHSEAQDFLDCVAIDEEKVKELIKELEKGLK